MEMDAIINSIIATISLLVGTLFGSRLQRLLTHPRVTIESTSDLKANNIKCVSIVVSNKGRTAAEKCVGSITFDNLTKDMLLAHEKAVDHEDLPESPNGDHGGLTPNSFRPIDRERLCWAHITNPDKYDINPGSKTLLDIFKAIKRKDSNQWYLIIPSENGWKKIRARLIDRNYCGKLIVSPANYKPTVKSFIIEPSREEEGPTLKLIK